MATNETPKRSIRIDDNLWEAARIKADREVGTVTGVITRALWAYVAPEEFKALAEARDTFDREMSQIHVTGPEPEPRARELSAAIREARAALDKAVEKAASTVRVPASWG